MNSASSLLLHLREGDGQAVAKLWERYFERMLNVARRKLGGAHRRVRDEEDIALSAFKSFCAVVQRGRFDRSAGDDLWPLLVSMTINKAIDHLRHSNRLKRTAQSTADSGANGNIDNELLVAQLLANDPSPEFQLMADESMAKLMKGLDETGDPSLRTLAIMRLEDSSHETIASMLGCTVRTVQRKLQTIRALWQAMDL